MWLEAHPKWLISFIFYLSLPSYLHHLSMTIFTSHTIMFSHMQWNSCMGNPLHAPTWTKNPCDKMLLQSIMVIYITLQKQLKTMDHGPWYIWVEIDNIEKPKEKNNNTMQAQQYQGKGKIQKNWWKPKSFFLCFALLCFGLVHHSL